MSISLTNPDIELLNMEKTDGKYGQDPHYNLAWARYLMTPSSTYLQERYWFYAALEYRLCVERFLFTLLVLVSGEESVTRAQEKLYTGSDLKKAVTASEPDLFSKLEYTDLMFKAIGSSLRTSKPNLDKLSQLYGRLGNYLHAQKRHPETVWSDTWLSKFLEQLEICDSEMGSLLAPECALAQFSPKGANYKNWKDGTLNDEEVIEAFRQEVIPPPSKEC